MKKRWFASLNRGIGWKPATWQGWTIIISYAVVVVWNFFRINTVSQSVSDTLLNFIPQTLLLTVLLAFICYFTGEKPRT